MVKLVLFLRPAPKQNGNAVNNMRLNNDTISYRRDETNKTAPEELTVELPPKRFKKTDARIDCN